MPKVRTKSLRSLATKIPPSIFSGAMEESADYIDELEKENELLKADNAVLQAKWETQGLMIQKLQEKNRVLKMGDNNSVALETYRKCARGEIDDI